MKEETRKKIYKELFPLEFTDEIYEQIIDRLLGRLNALKNNYFETSLMVANEQGEALDNKDKELDIWQEVSYLLANDLARNEDNEYAEYGVDTILENAYQKAKEKVENDKAKEASLSSHEEMTKQNRQNGEKNKVDTRHNGEYNKPSSHPKNTFKISIKAPDNVNVSPTEENHTNSNVVPGQVSLWDLLDDLDFDGDFKAVFTLDDEDDE